VPALLLNVLKLIFIGFLYLFLFQVARSIRSHLGGGIGRAGSGRAPAELVVVVSDSLQGRRYPVGAATVIGRSDDADVVVDDSYASDLHVRVGMQNGTMTVHDLGSTNGTYVNGRRITVPTAVVLGDSVQVGRTILEVK
jgi:hypothetical protein